MAFPAYTFQRQATFVPQSVAPPTSAAKATPAEIQARLIACMRNPGTAPECAELIKMNSACMSDPAHHDCVESGLPIAPNLGPTAPTTSIDQRAFDFVQPGTSTLLQARDQICMANQLSPECQQAAINYGAAKQSAMFKLAALLLAVAGATGTAVYFVVRRTK